MYCSLFVVGGMTNDGIAAPTTEELLVDPETSNIVSCKFLSTALIPRGISGTSAVVVQGVDEIKQLSSTFEESLNCCEPLDEYPVSNVARDSDWLGASDRLVPNPSRNRRMPN